MAILCADPTFFLILSLFFISCIQFIHSLSTVSISQVSNQTLVCALIYSPAPSRQSHLNCTSFPDGIRIPVSSSSSSSATSFSGIVGGNGFVCALSSSYSSSASRMVCWRFEVNGTNMIYKRIHDGPLVNELDSGYSHICGLFNGTNRIQCWQWHEFGSNGNTSITSSLAVGENFVCGLDKSRQIICLGSNTRVINHSPTGNYSLVAAGFRHACAISLNGSLECWGDMVGEKPQGVFTWVALGENRGCALKLDKTVLCWGENNYSLPASLQGKHFISIEAKQEVFCGILWENFSVSCWGNGFLELDSNSTVFNHVVPGPCRRQCPCNPLPSYGYYCGQGLMICEPCIQETSGKIPPTGQPPPPPPQRVTNGGGGGGQWDRKTVSFLVVGCIGSVSLVLVFCFLFLKYCKFRGCRVHDSGPLEEPMAAVQQSSQAPPQQQQQQQQKALEKKLSQLVSMGNGGGHLEEFCLEKLLKATNGFSEENKIGTGSFGSVYAGTLEDGREVAIKRAEVTASSSYNVYAGGGTKRNQEDKDYAFLNELEFLSRLNHKNLVRLLGYCEDCNERVLIYEYMDNGNLHDHLHKLQDSPLRSWSARIKIALDAARGIEYLHEYAVPQVIHRDIKSSNILLDVMWTAKVSDFGLSLMGPDDEESHLSLRAAGTVGYMDPEYYRLQKLTTKSDVYSYGVVLLELLSGCKAIHKNENGVPRNVVDYVVPYIVQDEIHRVLDQKVPPPTPFEIEAVAYVGYLAADCVTLEGRDRPTMTEIVNSLERALAACLASPKLSRSSTTTVASTIDA